MTPRSTPKPTILCTAPFRFLSRPILTKHFNFLHVPDKYSRDVAYLREFCDRVTTEGLPSRDFLNQFPEVTPSGDASLDSSSSSSTPLQDSVTSIDAMYLGMGGWASLNEDNFFSKLSDNALKNLKVISNHGVGYDNIDAEAAAKRGIIVTNTPGVVSPSTAEITLALMLNCSRKLRQQEASLREGKWSIPTLFGNELRGKTLGIVGLGDIGKHVAKRAQAFDMKVIYFNRNQKSEQFEKEHQVSYVPFEDLLKQSDFISLHCPLTTETRHLISEKEFNMMKPEAYVINASRGAVIDEKALLAALKANRIRGAGLDVHEFEPEITEDFLHLDNVSLLPHIGTHVVEARTDMESLCLENMKRVLVDGQAPKTPVAECKNISV